MKIPGIVITLPHNTHYIFLDKVMERIRLFAREMEQLLNLDHGIIQNATDMGEETAFTMTLPREASGHAKLVEAFGRFTSFTEEIRCTLLMRSLKPRITFISEEQEVYTLPSSRR